MAESMEERLTGEFKEHLERPLSNKEKAFVRWMAAEAGKQKDRRLYTVNHSKSGFLCHK